MSSCHHVTLPFPKGSFGGKKKTLVIMVATHNNAKWLFIQKKIVYYKSENVPPLHHGEDPHIHRRPDLDPEQEE